MPHGFRRPHGHSRAGFHPTAVIGALGAVLGLDARQMTDAMGVAGSMAGGIIEYLAEGTWSKQFPPGWAARSGLRGGRREPLSQAELEARFFANAAHGGWPEARARNLMDWCGEAFMARTLAGLAV